MARLLGLSAALQTAIKNADEDEGERRATVVAAATDLDQRMRTARDAAASHIGSHLAAAGLAYHSGTGPASPGGVAPSGDVIGRLILQALRTGVEVLASVVSTLLACASQC